MKRSSVPITIVGIILLIGLTTTSTWAAGPSTPNATSPAVPLCKSPYKKKMVPAKTLQELVRSHERWVEYRGNQNAKRMELCQADLSRAALTGANLERADLEGIVLRGRRIWFRPA
ncbi:MAG: pentapeptide repeat-containing protein [Nitrospira sp.]